MMSRRSTQRCLTILITIATLALTGATGFGAGVSSPDPDATRIVINIPSRTLWVYEGNQIVRYFPVGVGRVGYMTPMGQFSVIHKIIDPGWEQPYLPAGKVRIAPGENNPLGTRWIGFYQKGGGEYGMHGTDNPSSVGKYSSHGCVRMKVRDAETLFDMVDIGTPVSVVYDPVLVRPANGNMRIVVYEDRFHRGMPSAEKIKEHIMKSYPGSEVDVAKIQTALQHPAGIPVVVGTLPQAHPVAADPLAPSEQPTPGSTPPAASPDSAPQQQSRLPAEPLAEPPL